MKLSNFNAMWIYLLTFLGNFAFIASQINQLCIKQNLTSNVEITCSDIPLQDELKKMNNSITHQTIICSQQRKYRELTVNQTSRLKHLIFFHIKNCFVLDLPAHFFKDLVELQAVTLDNLPIRSLRENVFDNCSNLIELTLSRLKNLTTLHPRFLGYQNTLETLSIVESNIDTVQLRHILIPIYITLQNLYWRRNVQKLTFTEDYFNNFHFESLVLEYNGIENVDFLRHVSAKYLSLKGNPIGNHQRLIFRNYALLSEVVIVLDLSETGIDLIVPDSETNIQFRQLTELILKDNSIEDIPPRIELMFPRLQILDLRNNKLAIIPSLDYILKARFGRVYLNGNSFHCNCQMKWVQSFNETQIKDLHCRIMDDGNSTKQIIFTDQDVQSNMICTPPKLYLKINNSSRFKNYSSQVINETVKIYQIDIHPGEVFDWRCIGEGDPAPKLKLVKNREIKSKNPPSDKHKTQTIMSNLTISYTNLKESQNELIYTCKGKNLAGSSELQLRVIKKNKPRSVEKVPESRNLIHDKNSLKTMPNCVLLTLLISYYYLF